MVFFLVHPIGAFPTMGHPMFGIGMIGFQTFGASYKWVILCLVMHIGSPGCLVTNFVTNLVTYLVIHRIL